MLRTLEELKKDIVEIGRLAYQKGWVAANDGNFSVRLEDNTILCTPTMISKGMMTPDDLIIVNMDGHKVSGRGERTSEIAMHLMIYSMRPDIGGVVHVHPPVATGFAVAGKPLNRAVLPEVIISLGSVPLAEYGLPGTPALTAGMIPLIPNYDALLMASHGAVCYGRTVWDAFFKMETVEHFARINLVAELLGGPRLLPRGEVEKLFESRSRYGISSNARMQPGNPIVAEDTAAAPELPAGVSREALLALIDEALMSRGRS
jgi:L-fuculose-phosphate aldolase